jgi:transcriptional regulator with XRE-family HTH domain
MATPATGARGPERNGAGSGAGTGWEPIVGSIGPKVRELRQHLGLSLQQLAQRSDVSAAAIHKVERGDMVPTVTTMLKLAGALDKPIGHFVENAADHAPVAAYTSAAGRTALRATAAGVELAGITGPAGRFRAVGAVATIAPGAGGGAGQRPGEDLVLVLDGTLSFEVAGERYLLRKGDALHYPTDRPHHWSNPGRGPTRAVWISLHGG